MLTANSSRQNYPKLFRSSLLIFIWLLLCTMSGCSQESSVPLPAGSSNNGKLQVAVSIVPQETFVKAVAGDLADVITMVPPGSSPENYAPNPQQMQIFSQAKIYFAMGVATEQANILPKATELNKDMKIVDLAERIDALYPAREFAPGKRDPHMWLSPKRVQEIIKITAEELSSLDPEHATVFKQNAEHYNAQLEQLDQDIQSSLNNVANKKFIVYHPSLGYFADDYGLEMIALEKEGKEASAVDMQQVIDQGKKEGIKVIFYQAEIDSKQSRALAEELGGQTEMIAPLEPNYISNLEKTARTFARVLK